MSSFSFDVEAFASCCRSSGANSIISQQSDKETFLESLRFWTEASGLRMLKRRFPPICMSFRAPALTNNRGQIRRLESRCSPGWRMLSPCDSARLTQSFRYMKSGNARIGALNLGMTGVPNSAPKQFRYSRAFQDRINEEFASLAFSRTKAITRKGPSLRDSPLPQSTFSNPIFSSAEQPFHPCPRGPDCQGLYPSVCRTEWPYPQQSSRSSSPVGDIFGQVPSLPGLSFSAPRLRAD